jgi:serine/threonine-protein kinase
MAAAEDREHVAQAEDEESGVHQRTVRVARLASGGMAHLHLVLRREGRGAGTLLVEKTMRPELAEDAEARELFLAEARLSTRLDHPNVVRSLTVQADPETPSLLMEYLEGKPLGALLDDCRTLVGVPGLVAIVCQALEGLHYVHELRDRDGASLELVHLDVSPQNIFFTFGGEAKLLDFGICQTRSSPRGVDGSSVRGKIRYMAPEQLLGLPVDRRADLFAIGCILWHVATGERLWGNAPEADVTCALIEGEIPAPSSVCPVHPKLDAIVRSALATSPEQRPRTALELAHALRGYLEEVGEQPDLRLLGIALSRHFATERRARTQEIVQALWDTTKTCGLPRASRTQSGFIRSAPKLASPEAVEAVRQPRPAYPPPEADSAGAARSLWLALLQLLGYSKA